MGNHQSSRNRGDQFNVTLGKKKSITRSNSLGGFNKDSKTDLSPEVVMNNNGEASQPITASPSMNTINPEAKPNNRRSFSKFLRDVGQDDDDDDDEEDDEEDDETPETERLKSEEDSPFSRLPATIQMRQRKFKVYIACPQAGMSEERTALQTLVLPRLQRYCEHRGVIFLPVLLETNADDDLAQRGVLLETCLREIGSSDLFIGFYGAQYGWHGAQDPVLKLNIDKASQRFPWVNDLTSASFTEIEFTHGHLREASRPAFFFFRGADYDIQRRSDPQEPHPENYAPESEEADHSRFDLFVRLTNSERAIIFDNYQSPSQGVQLLMRALMAYVDRHYSRSKPGSFDMDFAMHEAFMHSRTRIHIIGTHYYDQLDQQFRLGALRQNSATTPIRGGGSPLVSRSTAGSIVSIKVALGTQSLVVTGTADSGKSAILANWVIRHQKHYSDHFLFFHFVGASNAARSPKNMVQRLVYELKCKFPFLTSETPVDFKGLLHQLTKWLSIVVERTRVVLVIDGLDAFEDTEDDPGPLRWLTSVLPESVIVLASSAPGQTITALVQNNAHTFRPLEVSALLPAEKIDIVATVAASLNQKVGDDDIERFLASPQTANPLFLSILLDEVMEARLKQTPQFAKKCLMELLVAVDCEELCSQALTRLETTIGDAAVVRDVFTYLLAARGGLTPFELTELLKMPANRVSYILSEMDRFIVRSAGVIQLGHEVLVRAASSRYFGEDCLNRRTARTEFQLAPTVRREDVAAHLATYFETMLNEYMQTGQFSLSNRVFEELPWLLSLSNDRERLARTLCCVPIFNIFNISDQRSEFLRYWSKTNPDADKSARLFNEGLAAYQVLLERVHARQTQDQHDKQKESHNNTASHLARANQRIGEFMRGQGFIKQAIPFLQTALSLIQSVHGSGSIEAAASLNDLGRAYFRLGRHSEALVFWKQALTIHEALRMKEDQSLAVTLNNVGLVYEQLGKWEEAEPMYLRALRIYTQEVGPETLDVAVTYHNLGLLYSKITKYSKAEEMFSLCIQIKSKVLGPRHGDLAMTQNNLAMVYTKLERYDKAIAAYSEAITIREESHGKEHPDVALFLFNLGVLLAKLDKKKEAKSCLFRAYELRKKLYGADHKNSEAVMSWIKYIGAENDLSVFEVRRGSLSGTLPARVTNVPRPFLVTVPPPIVTHPSSQQSPLTLETPTPLSA